MRRLKAKKEREGGTYRFRFLGKPMTFSKLCAYFEHKTTARKLKAVWLAGRRPYKITDPEFFADAFVSSIKSVEVVGVGTFPTAAAVARAFKISRHTVARRIKEQGTVLRPEGLQISTEIQGKMSELRAAKHLKKAKKKAARRSPRQSLPSDEWLSFTDRPRAHTGY